MASIAFFDFDGTVTNEDSFTKFIYFAADKKRLKKGKLLLLPYIIGYKIGIVSGAIIRTRILKYGFSGINANIMKDQGLIYSREEIPNMLRADVLERLKWHVDNGHRVVIVSASMDIYLRPWCELNGFDLICSEVEIENGLVTGRYKNKDCSSYIKKERILSNYKLSNYDEIYVYGDSSEDLEMMSLGTRRYFKGKEI